MSFIILGQQEKIKLFSSNPGMRNVNWPPLRVYKADISSVSPSSEKIEELWSSAIGGNMLSLVAWINLFAHIPQTTHNSSIRYDQGLTLEKSGSGIFYGG